MNRRQVQLYLILGNIFPQYISTQLNWSNDTLSNIYTSYRTSHATTSPSNSGVHCKPSSYSSPACDITTGGYLHLLLLRGHCCFELRAAGRAYLDKKATRTDVPLIGNPCSLFVGHLGVENHAFIKLNHMPHETVVLRQYNTGVALPTKKNIFLAILRSNRQLEPPLPLKFFL